MSDPILFALKTSMSKRIVPPAHTLLQEAILQFYHELPHGVADLRISPNASPTVFAAAVVPHSAKATRISVSAEEGDWEAAMAFGRSSHIQPWYFDEPDANQRFKERILTICRAIACSHWQERIVLRGDTLVICFATLPSPIGKVRTPGDWFLLYPFWKKKMEEVIIWEPYVCPEHGIPERTSSS